jgi:hypothetical protein
MMSAFEQANIPSRLPHGYFQKPIRIEKLKEMAFCTAITN